MHHHLIILAKSKDGNIIIKVSEQAFTTRALRNEALKSAYRKGDIILKVGLTTMLTKL